MLGFDLLRGCHPLFGRPRDRSAVAEAFAQTLDISEPEHFIKAVRRRVVVGDAFASRQPDRAPDLVEVVNAVSRQRGEIKTVEDGKRDQELKAFAGRGRYIDNAVAIDSFHRIGPARPEFGDIGLGDKTAGRRKMSEEPSVKVASAIARDLCESARKIGLAKHEATLDPPAAIGVVPRPWLPQLRDDFDSGSVWLCSSTLNSRTGKPVSASRMAGAKTAARSIVPCRASNSVHPARLPGVPTEMAPRANSVRRLKRCTGKAEGMRGTKLRVRTRRSRAIQHVARPMPARLDM